MEELLRQAKRSENEYDWLGAVELYGKALDLLPVSDFSNGGQIQEGIGYALYRAAMQAESQEEFRKRMRLAVENYGKAKKLYERLIEPRRTPRILRCDAMITLIGCWLEPQAPQKSMLVNDCWRITKEALKTFDENEDTLEKARTYTQLSMSAVLGWSLTQDSPTIEKSVRDAVELGEKTISLLSTLGDSHELAKAYVKTAAYTDLLGFLFSESDEKKRALRKAASYWSLAVELSEETAMIELLSALGFASLDWGDGADKPLRVFEKALEYGSKTKDHFLLGTALDCLAYHTCWSGLAKEDSDERKRLFERALQYVEDARRHYSLISFIGPARGVLWVEAPHADYYFNLARHVETDLTKKRELMEKALEAAPDMMERAKSSGYINANYQANHVFSLVLYLSAMVEKRPEQKRALLEKALEHRIEAKQLMDRLAPCEYWDQGIYQGSAARIKFELSDVTKNVEAKKNQLEEAITDMEKAEELLKKGIASYEEDATIALFAILGRGQYEHGNWLNRLHEFSNDKEDLKRAVKAFIEGAESFQKPGLTSRVAECYWKAAQVYDRLGEHLRAAENFDLASNNYESAAEKISQLKEFYQNHALYMQAWSEIEKAKHDHERQEYGSAKEHFEKASELHKSLKHWGYLEPNYSAWAQVERAEELSRKEEEEEAIKAFEQASERFGETKKSLQTQLSVIEDEDEKQMTASIIEASDLRREYCDARVAIEEAKILDKKGDHFASSGKYGSASETFQRISEALGSDQERSEFKLLIVLSRAWQKMTLAESEASPKLYAEASQLFEEAKDFSQNDKTKMLMLGHSRFCKALEAGTRFADTRDPAMHASATKYLESAASYYVKAGFPKASEYAEATELLLDAYAHMDDAKEEKDPERKAKLYAMAEMVLQKSAGSFMRAEHPEKREQVLGLLERVKKERELALSLAELLRAPRVVSATTSFTTPAPTREEAVGSERFEQADVQANLIVRHRELKVGENLDLEIELVNAGKGPAVLVKVTEVIPKGFEIVERPDAYRVEDSYVNMKGRRLDPLKTEELRFVLKPRVQGSFDLKPTVLYLDENGKYKSHKPEPVNIIVKELGVKGWLKGER